MLFNCDISHAVRQDPATCTIAVNPSSSTACEHACDPRPVSHTPHLRLHHLVSELVWSPFFPSSLDDNRPNFSLKQQT